MSNLDFCVIYDVLTNHIEAAEPTGSPSGPPPAVSKDIASTVQDAASKDSMGQNVAGKDTQDNNAGQTVMGDAGKEKTAKESMQDSAAGPH